MLGVPRPRLLLFNPYIPRECADTLFREDLPLPEDAEQEPIGFHSI